LRGGGWREGPRKKRDQRGKGRPLFARRSYRASLPGRLQSARFGGWGVVRHLARKLDDWGEPPKSVPGAVPGKETVTPQTSLAKLGLDKEMKEGEGHIFYRDF